MNCVFLRYEPKYPIRIFVATNYSHELKQNELNLSFRFSTSVELKTIYAID